MTNESLDRDSWERRWEQALREHPDAVASRPPNAHLLAEFGDLQPGRALDAGCGHGSEAIWLAASGWQVTAVDFAVTALEHGRSRAQTVGPDVADRITWVEGDLGSWAPTTESFDLVSCLYVHVAGEVGEMVRRLGTGVAAGGTLFLVGHRPVDPATGAPTPAGVRCRCPSMPPSTLSIRVSGRSSSQRIGRGPWSAPVSMRWCTRSGAPDAPVTAFESTAHGADSAVVPMSGCTGGEPTHGCSRFR